MGVVAAGGANERRSRADRSYVALSVPTVARAPADGASVSIDDRTPGSEPTMEGAEDSQGAPLTGATSVAATDPATVLPSASPARHEVAAPPPRPGVLHATETKPDPP